MLDQTLDCCRHCLRALVGPGKPCLACGNPDRLPHRIGPYAVRSLLGAGAMGCVYECADESRGGTVAVRVLSPRAEADHGVVDRFLREARTLARVRHENVVALRAVGQVSGTVFVVMEHVQGPSLETHLAARGRLDPRTALACVCAAARGLAAVHARGLVHRDVRPASLLLGADGRVRVADLGLAPMLPDRIGLTATGTITGTAEYMSPEQARGLNVDARSDLYSLGITFFRMLTGELPYRDPDPLSVLVQHVVAPLPDVLERVPDLHPALGPLLDRMTAKNPDDRYPDLDAFLEAAGEVLEALELAERESEESDLAGSESDEGAPEPAMDLAESTGEALLLGSIREGSRPMMGVLLGGVIALALGIGPFLLQEPLPLAQGATRPDPRLPAVHRRARPPRVRAAVLAIDPTAPTVTATRTALVTSLVGSPTGAAGARRDETDAGTAPREVGDAHVLSRAGELELSSTNRTGYGGPAMASPGERERGRETLAFALGSPETARSFHFEHAGQGDRAVPLEDGRLRIEPGGFFAATHSGHFAGDFSTSLDVVLRAGATAALVIRGRMDEGVLAAILHAGAAEPPLGGPPDGLARPAGAGAGVILVAGMPAAVIARSALPLEAAVPHHVELTRCGSMLRVRIDRRETLRATAPDLEVGAYQVGIAAPAGGVELGSLRITPERIVER